MAAKKVKKDKQWIIDGLITVGLLIFVLVVLWFNPHAGAKGYWQRAGGMVASVLIGVPFMIFVFVGGIVGLIRLNRWVRRLKYPPQEAGAWLKEVAPERAFAGNRFADLNAVKIFVQELYNAGALKVEVENIRAIARTETLVRNGRTQVIPSTGQQLYADTLTVTLPKLADERKKIFKIYLSETKKEFGKEGTPVRDRGQNTIEFWWD